MFCIFPLKRKNRDTWKLLTFKTFVSCVYQTLYQSQKIMDFQKLNRVVLALAVEPPMNVLVKTGSLPQKNMRFFC